MGLTAVYTVWLVKKNMGGKTQKKCAWMDPPFLALIIGSKCNKMMCDGY